MSEAEIADMYRSRFLAHTDQAERLKWIVEKAMANTGPPGPWLAMSLVPNSPGSLPMSFAEKAAT
jgi:hypothetical protein